MNFLKPIRDYGFVKKYQIICVAMPYVTGIRPEQIQAQLMLEIIGEIYVCYQGYIRNGLWKSKQHYNHLQEFTLLYLHELYISDPKLKRKYSQFDRFVLNFFYTLNVLKTCNKFIKCFSNFLNSVYSFGQLFLYLCLKNISITHNNEDLVPSSTLKKVIRIFQTEQNSHNVSQCLSKDSITIEQEQDKLVGINSIFVEPVGGGLAFPKVKMYKIMKICKIVSSTERERETDTVEWGEFLRKYFQILEKGEQICFQHIVSAAVAKNTYQLSKTLLNKHPQQTQQQFLEQAFSYVFSILELIFQQQEPSVSDSRTQENIHSLRTDFLYLRKLSEYNITVMNKFSKKILKNSFVLGLYKKYG